MYNWFPPLNERLNVLAGIIDEMADQAGRKYPGRRLDLAVLPEMAVWRAEGPPPVACAPLDGPVLDRMGAKAREYDTYLVVSMYLAEEGERYSNAAVLLDRRGKPAGIYRKVFVVVDKDGLLEGGLQAGKDFPVFDCDFGRIGAQICYDMMFDDGWRALARKGAEIVVWPTQSPQTARPACRALTYGYYVVSSTWRNNAAIYEPTGMTVARITRPGVLVHEIDLDYALLPWSAGLREGAAMRERYGDRVGFNYYVAEDRGIFWSNDPAMPIRRMVVEAGLWEEKEEYERDRRRLDELRGGPPSPD
jgi:predicted amidohydrolase